MDLKKQRRDEGINKIKYTQEDCDDGSFSQNKVKISFETACAGIREICDSPQSLNPYEVCMEPNTKVVFFAPDMGREGEKDEMIIPNLHNGIFRIHAFLYDKGILSTMIDTGIDNMESVWEQIAQHKPAFVAFSPYYDSMQNDLHNICKIQEISPNSIIIAGGFEASLNNQWNKLGKFVDILIRGEGEFALVEIVNEYQKFLERAESFKDKSDFLKFLRKKLQIKEIPGICVAEEDGTLKPPLVRRRIDPETYQNINLNAFEKHLSLSPIKKYWRLSKVLYGGEKDSYFRFVTSDHCPYKCIFCQSSVYYAKIMGEAYSPVRYITPENIIRIMKAISLHCPFITGIYIDDENFLVNRERAVQTLQLIIDNKKSGDIQKKIYFQCRTRVDNIDPEICNLLKEAGCIMVSVGSESYSAQELDYMRKNTSPEKNLSAVKTILNSGLKAAENYILYTPITTADTFYENAMGICRNIGELDVDGNVNAFLNPLPGTDLWGDGEFEVIDRTPCDYLPFEDKVLFHNKKTGYDYLGKEIFISEKNMTIPHPEIVLLTDPIMRQASLESFKYLLESFKILRRIAGKHIMSQSFITLANLLAASQKLHELTSEPRWKELNNEIKKIVRGKSWLEKPE